MQLILKCIGYGINIIGKFVFIIQPRWVDRSISRTHRFDETAVSGNDFYSSCNVTDLTVDAHGMPNDVNA